MLSTPGGESVVRALGDAELVTSVVLFVEEVALSVVLALFFMFRSDCSEDALAPLPSSSSSPSPSVLLFVSFSSLTEALSTPPSLATPFIEILSACSTTGFLTSVLSPTVACPLVSSSVSVARPSALVASRRRVPASELGVDVTGS